MKHFALLLVMLLLTSGKISAQDLSTLIPDNTTGAVSQAEIDRFDDYYKNFKIPINNNKKSMTWILSPFIHSLVFMYETTNDLKYIDYAITCCDIVQSGKRTSDIDYVTQEIIPGWAYFYEQFTDSLGNPAMYNNVVGNGAIIRAMSSVAWVIQRDNLSDTYQEKGQTYIESCVETINSFINSVDWFDSTARLFHFPDNKRHDDCLQGVRGLTSAYNRQLIMAAGMSNVVNYYEMKQEEAALQLNYTKVIESVAHYFWNSLSIHGSGESTYYLWMYRAEGSNGGAPSIEDIGHGGYDIQCITQLHYDLDIGTAKQLSYLANTLIEHTQYDSLNHAFANKIDGSNKYNNPESQRTKSMRWISLSDWDDRVFANAGWQLTNGVKVKKSLSYSEFLYYKSKRFVTNVTASNISNSNVPSASEITIFPNPSNSIINVSFSLEKNQTINISIIEPVSGRNYKTISNEFQANSICNMPFDISNLPKGIYLMVIQTKDTIISKKFLKI